MPTLTDQPTTPAEPIPVSPCPAWCEHPDRCTWETDNDGQLIRNHDVASYWTSADSYYSVQVSPGAEEVMTADGAKLARTMVTVEAPMVELTTVQARQAAAALIAAADRLDQIAAGR